MFRGPESQFSERTGQSQGKEIIGPSRENLPLAVKACIPHAWHALFG